MKIFQFLIFLILILHLISCNKKYPTIYQVSGRQYFYELSKKYGRPINVDNFPYEELKNIKGMDIFWLMGVWKLGDLYKVVDFSVERRKEYRNTLDFPQWKDIIGSPFAITDYLVNPDIGTLEGLKKFRKNLNLMGIKLLLDFVPNHTAMDAPLVTSNPELFMNYIGVPVPFFDEGRFLPNGVAYGGDGTYVWQDTAQLNYWNKDTVEYSIKNLLIVTSLADYIRCDMAMLQLNKIISRIWEDFIKKQRLVAPKTEFWKTAISKAKTVNPNITFVAEVYWGCEQDLLNEGFHFVYDKNLIHEFHYRDANRLKSYIKYSIINTRSVKFLENHDEPRAAAEFKEYYFAAAVIAYTLPGMRFFHHGQLEGKKIRQSVHLMRCNKETPVPEIIKFYDILIPIINHTVFQSRWNFIDDSPDPFVSMKWIDKTTMDRRIIIVNYSGSRRVNMIPLPDCDSKLPTDDVIFHDLFTGEKYTYKAQTIREQGLYVALNGWGFHIFDY